MIVYSVWKSRWYSDEVPVVSSTLDIAKEKERKKEKQKKEKMIAK